jgi:hypothetical protein
VRTVEQIVQHVRDISQSDIFGFTTSDLLDFVPFDSAKEFLKPDSHEEAAKEWKFEAPAPETIKAKMKDYLTFAFGKAEDHRGLSAGRSISHFKAWVWLMDDATEIADVMLKDLK